MMFDLFGSRSRYSFSDTLEHWRLEKEERNRHEERMAEIAAKRNTWTYKTITRTLIPSKKPTGLAMRAEDI